MKRLRWFLACVFLSMFAVMSLLARPVEASANFTIANCFRRGLGSWPAWTQDSFNQKVRSVVGNNDIQINLNYRSDGPPDSVSITSVTVNGQPVQAQLISITHNSHGGTNCAGFSFFADAQTTSVFKLFNADGTESGYGLRNDCANLVRYPVTQASWESTGETQILGTTPDALGWTKAHPESAPMDVAPGTTVQWRHRINITNITGNPTFNIQATTQQSSGVAGESAIFNNHTVTVQGSGATRATNWYTRSWTVPESANPGDVFCQHWTWTPANGSDNSSTGSSEAASGPNTGTRQCVRVIEEDMGTCPPLTGTTTLNGSTTDITVEPGTSVTWTHTLSQTATINIHRNCKLPTELDYRRRRHASKR